MMIFKGLNLKVLYFLREVEFYNITLENVEYAIKMLQKEGVAIDRPADFFAEMFKSDK
jgi:hypothetical protein